MGRKHRIDIADLTYHVINRSNAKIPLFTEDFEFLQFEKVLEEAKDLFSLRIYAYCVMPNHWHLIVSPRRDGELSKFMQWLTLTHTQRFHTTKDTVGAGHIYQGRYKSFIIQTDEYFLQVCRYVEQNPLRAGLVQNSLDWHWGSLWRREFGTLENLKLLNEWQTPPPPDYLKWINEREWDDTLDILRKCTNKELPFGKNDWKNEMARKYKIKLYEKRAGRPVKAN